MPSFAVNTPLGKKWVPGTFSKLGNLHVVQTLEEKQAGAELPVVCSVRFSSSGMPTLKVF